jgi:hypothetical protein
MIREQLDGGMSGVGVVVHAASMVLRPRHIMAS